MDDLASLASADFLAELVTIGSAKTNPWQYAELDEDSVTELQVRLHASGQPILASRIAPLLHDNSFHFMHNELVHYDVRRDNCAWNPRLSAVKLIDWNWFSLGDRTVDQNALLVNMYQGGLAMDRFKARLDQPALLWLAVYWLSNAMLPGSPSISNPVKLRSYQFDSGVAAYKLAMIRTR